MSKPQLTIEAFADWCEKQPADLEYNVLCPRQCAVGQFARDIGFPHGSTTGFQIDAGRGRCLTIQGLTDYHAIDFPNTFGALAARLRAAS